VSGEPAPQMWSWASASTPRRGNSSRSRDSSRRAARALKGRPGDGRGGPPGAQAFPASPHRTSPRPASRTTSGGLGVLVHAWEKPGRSDSVSGSAWRMTRIYTERRVRANPSSLRRPPGQARTRAARWIGYTRKPPRRTRQTRAHPRRCGLFTGRCARSGRTGRRSELQQQSGVAAGG